MAGVRLMLRVVVVRVVVVRVVVVRMVVMIMTLRVVVMRVLGRGGAALAVHPTRVAVDIVLLLPDRDAVLHLVDDVAARPEGLITVRRGDAHPHRDLAERQVADAVHATRVAHPETRAGFGDDALTLAYGELLEGLVLEAAYGAALVEVAHPTLEGRVTAAGRVDESACERGRVDGRVAELETAHGSRSQPPATGGMKTTLSPATNGCSQSPNSPLTATFSISVGSVKPWRARSSA